MQLVSFGPDKIYKHCSEKRNIFKGENTIKLGTLWGFRREEKVNLRDEGEGAYEYKLAFSEPTVVPNDVLSSFSLTGETRVEIGQMHITGSDIAVTELTMSGSCENCWIYCMSLSDRDVGNISQEHADKWELPADKIRDFAHYIAGLILEFITLDDLPAHFKDIPINRLSKGLSIDVDARPVQYADRELKIESIAGISSDTIKSAREMIPFIKPSEFSAEREFRFAFHVRFEGRRVSIEDRSKIVHLRPLDQLFR